MIGSDHNVKIVEWSEEDQTRIEVPMATQSALVHHRSPSEAKIALFRSLFRGRDDVYARRFESRKTGKSGYQPACGKCANCPHQAFLPITDEVIRWHLSGHDDAGRDFVMGVYPMLRDETCFFLAADFKMSGRKIPLLCIRTVPLASR